MAAGILPPESGSEFSPCESCEHRDCAAMRVIAGSICHLCEKPIGYETRFYQVDDRATEYVHALCEELAIEAEQKARDQGGAS